MNKLAVIGTGKWGKVLVKQFSELGIVKYGVNRGNKGDIRWFKKNYPNVVLTTNVEDILKDNELKAVVIATPIATHHKIVKQSLMAGMHVFAEKPLAQSVTECNELYSLADSKNKLLFVDNTYSYDPAFEVLKNTLKKTSNISWTKFHWEKWGSFESDILWNLAYHDIYLTLALYGKPQQSKILKLSKNKVHMNLLYKHQAVNIIIKRDSLNNSEKNIKVKTDSGLFTLKNSVLSMDVNGKKSVLFKSDATSLETACCKFMKELKNDTYKNTDRELSISTVAIIEEIKKSQE